MPILGPATVIASTITTLITPPRSIHFGPVNPSRRPPTLRRATRRTTSARRGADEHGARERLEAADAVAEPALGGDLHRPAEAGDECERGCNSGRAHGA